MGVFFPVLWFPCYIGVFFPVLWFTDYMGVFFPANCMSYGRMTTETHTQSDTDKSEDKINEADKTKSSPSALFQTLQAFNTRQPQPDKYILIYHHNPCLTVLSSLRRSGLPRNSLHVLYCHVKSAFLLALHVFGPCFGIPKVILVWDLFFLLKGFYKTRLNWRVLYQITTNNR